MNILDNVMKSKGAKGAKGDSIYRKYIKKINIRVMM